GKTKSETDGKGKKKLGEGGIYFRHAYVIEKIYKIKDRKIEELTENDILLDFLNPWGIEHIQGLSIGEFKQYFVDLYINPVSQKDIPPKVPVTQESPKFSERESPYTKIEKDYSTNGIFALKSDAASTVKIDTTVKFSVEQVGETVIPQGSRYRFQWSALNDPTTTNGDSRVVSVTNGPTDRQSVDLQAEFLGKHIIKVYVYLDEADKDDDAIVAILEYEQTVTDDGRTLFHQNLIEKANQTEAEESVIEWNDTHAASYVTNVQRGKPDAPIMGLPDNMNIWDFKYQWVRGYANVIEKAAEEFNLPVVLLAGIAFREVAGDPPTIDDLAYQGRKPRRYPIPPIPGLPP
ncbi:MAG: hypothetical protein SVK08_13920, partial [Halobacteriota archaeon]|nr:hypothetical protein [Halobacteriota archaeon]